MHDDIKRFSISGEINDSNIVEARERHILFVEGMMRDEGFVPALDLDPQFTVNYKPHTETYEFELSVYGIFLGKDKECEAAGVMSGKIMSRYIPQAR